MRNYIILNNQRSDELSGLIIQELAPISKPLQRTQVETIDGRDGDIVTPLGYAAYDKKITIGLYGDFDINEIIAYFATQGTAIFSNEPDKYYNYQILDQIDYERLIRFRVATVTMHVQPFKYSATEGTLTIDASDTVSGDGSDIALDGTAEAPFNVLRHKGNATQDGTPTPDNPIEIKVLTGDSTVKITGKNLLDNTAEPNFASGVSIASIPTGFRATNTTSGQYHYASFYTKMRVSVGQTWTISAKMSPSASNKGRITVGLADIDGSNGTSKVYLDANGSKTFTIEQADMAHPYIFYFVYGNLTGTASANDYVDYTDVQLELNDQATAFELYEEQSYVIPFGDTYLAAIGDYADEPVKVDGTWYIRRAIGKVDLGTLTWVSESEYGVGQFRANMTSTQVPEVPVVQREILCSHFTWQPSANYNTMQEGHMAVTNSQAVPILRTRSSVYSSMTANDFKTAISGIYLYYPIYNTPTDEAITDQDLIDALDEFYGQAHSYKGHTHITATTEDGNAPAVLAVEVGEDNESTVTNAGNTTSRPILTIYGQGDIGVYINDVEVLDIALGNEQYITLDSTEMDAYKDSPANLKNRLVTGDYSKLALNAGANKIRFTGTVTKYEISKYSRWL